MGHQIFYLGLCNWVQIWLNSQFRPISASSVASPLCTWLVAACMSCACEKDQAVKSPLLFQSPKSPSRSARRRKVVAAQSGFNGGGGGGVNSFPLSCGLVSCGCGYGIQNLVRSFDPCEEYYNSYKGFSSSALFGENGFSLFGSKTVPMTRRQGPMRRAAQSENRMQEVVADKQFSVVECCSADSNNEKDRPKIFRRRYLMVNFVKEWSHGTCNPCFVDDGDKAMKHATHVLWR